MKRNMSKAELIRKILATNPRLTSGQLAREVGVDSGYVRAALRRSNLSTIYGAGLGKGSKPIVKEPSHV